METVFGLNFFVFCILVLIVVLYFSNEARYKKFEGINVHKSIADTSKAVHEPFVAKQDDPNRKPDQDMYDQIQKNLTQKALIELTEPGQIGDQYAPASI